MRRRRTVERGLVRLLPANRHGQPVLRGLVGFEDGFKALMAFVGLTGVVRMVEAPRSAWS